MSNAYASLNLHTACIYIYIDLDLSFTYSYIAKIIPRSALTTNTSFLIYITFMATVTSPWCFKTSVSMTIYTVTTSVGCILAVLAFR